MVDGWGTMWGTSFMETSLVMTSAGALPGSYHNPLGVTVIDLREPTLREVWAD